MRLQYEQAQHQLAQDRSHKLNYTDLLATAEALRDSLVGCNSNLLQCRDDLLRAFTGLETCEKERDQLKARSGKQPGEL